jgi:hypothetical protein
MWLDHLPASVAFCDVETTGLGNHDRIVSFGGIGNDQPRAGQRPARSGISVLVFEPVAARRPASGSTARLAPLHSIQLPSR